MSLSKQTALYQEHIKLQAKLVDFFSWQLPLDYGSALKEHQAVRQNMGLFDVSHMTIVDLIGAGCRPFLRYLMTKDIDAIQYPGGACYTCMCNEQGGIIDDVIVYYRSPDNYRLVFNAARKEQVLDWLHQHMSDFNLGLQVRYDLAMLAIQGPKAFETLLQTLSPYEMDGLSTLKRFNSLEIQARFFARTGYTGEDGVECILNPADACDLWQKLIQLGATPCGLAARDSLRVEAGLMLNGQDMNEQVTPLECGLEWTISWQDTNRLFIGKQALLQQKQEGIQNKLIGVYLEERAILRHDQIIYANQDAVGKITSGIFSPELQKSIGFARVNTDAIALPLEVDIRGKRYPVHVHSTRFYSNSKK